MEETKCRVQSLKPISIGEVIDCDSFSIYRLPLETEDVEEIKTPTESTIWRAELDPSGQILHLFGYKFHRVTKTGGFTIGGNDERKRTVWIRSSNKYALSRVQAIWLAVKRAAYHVRYSKRRLRRATARHASGNTALAQLGESTVNEIPETLRFLLYDR